MSDKLVGRTNVEDHYHERRIRSKQRFVIKQIEENVKRNYEICYQAIIDMMFECHFLAALNHPSIVKIRALSNDGFYHPDSFLMIDRIHETLNKRLKRWKKKGPTFYSLPCTSTISKLRNPYGNPVSHADRRTQESLRIAYNLLSGIVYLHNAKSIIHRDLKPDNIGFDFQDELKLYDFGLAKDLRLCEKDENGLYRLTPNTGTLRYMAPEVLTGKRYNASVDLYSFGMIFWQILSLQIPFQAFDFKTFQLQVVEKRFRPKVNSLWPDSIRALIEKCWSFDLRKRPEAGAALKFIKDELVSNYGYNENDIGITCRKYY